METNRPVVERWFFYQDTAGLWKWARLDVVGTILGHSGSSFDSRDACVANARQSGYEDERPHDVGVALPQDRLPHGQNLTRGNCF